MLKTLNDLLIYYNVLYWKMQYNILQYIAIYYIACSSFYLFCVENNITSNHTC